MRLTYGQVHDRVIRLSNALRELGLIGAGDRGGQRKSGAIDLERKCLLDNIKIAVYNLKEMLLDVFAGCYNDPKDIRQILQMIIERGSRLHLVDGTLNIFTTLYRSN